MGCLSITLTQAAPRPKLTLEPQKRASLALHDGHGNPPRKNTDLYLSPTPGASLALTAFQRAALTLATRQRASLVVGEVCSVGDGELMVLASTNGPLRFRDGGYWLLDPSNESSGSRSASQSAEPGGDQTSDPNNDLIEIMS